jgi:3,5-epimerase/4-reductase
MKNRILVLGEGYIGSRLKEELGCFSSQRRISSFADAQEEIQRFGPTIIINCVGHLGRNVDDCELDIDRTLIANTFVPIILAEVALRNRVRLIHISSGCIYHYDYSKDVPMGENKTPDFFELFYSRSKIYSESALAALSKRYPVLILRIRVPLDERPHPRNILTKLINYKRVIDLPNSLTYIPDFIRALVHLVRVDATGIYNIVNKGALKYPELMQIYKKYVPDFEYEVIDYKKLNTVRTNLILSTEKLESSGFKVRDIHEVLEECVCQYLRY